VVRWLVAGASRVADVVATAIEAMLVAVINAVTERNHP